MSCVEIESFVLLQVEKESAKQKRTSERTDYGIRKGLLRGKQRSSRIQTDEY